MVANNHMGQVKTVWAMRDKSTGIPILNLAETVRVALIKVRGKNWIELKVHIP